MKRIVLTVDGENVDLATLERAIRSVATVSEVYTVCIIGPEAPTRGIDLTIRPAIPYGWRTIES